MKLNSLLHVILPGVDMLEPQQLLRAVQRVGGEGWLGHLWCSRPAGRNGETERLLITVPNYVKRNGCSI